MEQIGNTGSVQYNKTDAETLMEEVVNKIPAVSPKNTYAGNRKAIEDEITARMNKLRAQLRSKRPQPIDATLERPDGLNIDVEAVEIGKIKLDTNKVFSDIVQQLNDDLVGFGTVSKDVLKLVNKLLKDSDGSLDSLLTVRQEFDKVAKARGKWSTETQSKTAWGVSTDTIRSRLNQAIDDALPDGDVKQQLREVSTLFNAKEILLDKVAVDANNSFQRVFNNLKSLDTYITMPKTPLGLAATFSFIGSNVSGSPLAASAGGAVLGAGLGIAIYKGKINPTWRAYLGKLVKQVDKGIKITRNSEMRQALIADRAVLIEAMKLPNDSTPVEEEQQQAVNQ